ncbi:MAG: hypothetical protein F6J97_20650, partial [Leptolyngbya sp. SIO4C1]|nr:hypothetical protein [Leptolyngbya sp. SIO4C1]
LGDGWLAMAYTDPQKAAAAVATTAVLRVHPARPADEKAAALEQVHLNGFTLRPASSTAAAKTDGIVLKQVLNGSLTHLAIAPGGRNALVLEESENVKLEYVALPEKSS